MASYCRLVRAAVIERCGFDKTAKQTYHSIPFMYVTVTSFSA